MTKLTTTTITMMLLVFLVVALVHLCGSQSSGGLLYNGDSQPNKNNTPKCNNQTTLSSDVVVLNETGTVQRDEPWQWECTYSTDPTNPLTLRVAVTGDANSLKTDRPILVVVWQKTQVLSWQVPFVANDTFFYWRTERTLCPENIQQPKNRNDSSINESTIIVSLSTSSPQLQAFRVVAYFLGSRRSMLPDRFGRIDTSSVAADTFATDFDMVPPVSPMAPHITNDADNDYSSSTSSSYSARTNLTARQFELDVGKAFSFQASPSMPQFFYFEIPNDSDKIILRMNSTSDTCAILSIQPALCPVGDLIEQVKYRGYYQTVMSHGAITISRDPFNTTKFFAVVVVMPSDSECTVKSKGEPLPVPRNISKQHDLDALEQLLKNSTIPFDEQVYRMKQVTLTLVETISFNNYLIAVFAPVGILLAIVVASLVMQLTNICKCIQITPEDEYKEVKAKSHDNIVAPAVGAAAGVNNSDASIGKMTTTTPGYYGTIPTPGRYVPREQRQPQQQSTRSPSAKPSQTVMPIVQSTRNPSTTAVNIVPTPPNTTSLLNDGADAAILPHIDATPDGDGGHIHHDNDAFDDRSNDQNNYNSSRTVNSTVAGDGSVTRRLTPPPAAATPSSSSGSILQRRSKLAKIQKNPNQNPNGSHHSSPKNGHPYMLPTTASDEDEDLELQRQVDFVPDHLNERDVIRAKNELFVADLTKKGLEKLRSKDRQYPMSLLTVVIFYCLPVAQLVIAYQLQLQTTGDEDLCFYNFDCARPWYIFSDFNHIVSNSGYMILGILFIIIVGLRDRQYRREKLAMDENDEDENENDKKATVSVAAQPSNSHTSLNPQQSRTSGGPDGLVEAVKNPKYRQSASQRWEDERGIPPQFGILYSMGIALFVEGLMSACYHVCPNRSNFQFDTAFMYLIAGLSILRLYQCRHPDIHPKAYIAYLIYAIIISIAVAGVLIDLQFVWIVFCVLLISFSLFIAFQLYFLGQWSLEYSTIHNTYVRVRGGRCSAKYCLPSRPVSFILGMMIVALNSFFGIFGALRAPNDFATYLLTVLLSNGTLYLVYYCVMKMTSKEKISTATKTFALLALATWIGSMYLFLYPLTNSMRTAAQSRQGNKPCFVLDFYDEHDAWHFLSSLAVYLSFLVFLTIDDDLKFTPRDKILVF